MTKTEWLKEMPPSEEITDINGILVILSHIVKDKLDFLTDSNWSTRNYSSKYIKIDGIDNISASIELVVNYDGVISRTLVGAVTFPLKFFPDNTHWDNTANTLCIVNAASNLGNQFGRALNKIGAVVNNRNIDVKPVKMKADIHVLKAYSDAITSGDSEKIKNLQDVYELNIGGEDA